jgi:hypothetical protein
MSDQSGSSHLRVLFEAALEDYKQQTGIELAKHPLAERLQDCNSVESVTAIIREQTQDFKKFREKDKVLKSLKRVLTVLYSLSSAANFAQDVGMVCPRRRQVFNISDSHPIAFPARESNTDWPRYSILCVYLYLVSSRASL